MLEKLLTGTFTFNTSAPLHLGSCTKSDIKAYFENTFDIEESLFTSLTDDAVLYKSPDLLRLPLIYYYGHTACFFVNKMVLGNLLKDEERIDAALETMFEAGVDEMSWDSVEVDRSGSKFQWPSVDDVIDYRRRVRRLVCDVIDRCDIELPVTIDSKLWPLLMGIEHDRVHIETSSVLIRQLPVAMVTTPPGWNYAPTESESKKERNNPMIGVKESQVVFGKPETFPSFGWDVDYGITRVNVPSFEATKYPITNGQFLEFVVAGGYTRRDLWSDEGWRWVQSRQARHPTFWICAHGCRSGCGGDLVSYTHCHGDVAVDNNDAPVYRLRTMFDVVDLALCWPVEVNYHEAKAYCAWRGPHFRLLAEAEYHALRAPLLKEKGKVESDVIFDEILPGNLNLQFGSTTPVDMFPPNSLGFHDVRGNVWQWTEDHVTALVTPFRTSYLYDDYSTSFFDGRHNVIVGGSWVSTGEVSSVFTRLWFRRHFFQQAGFRLVRSVYNESDGRVLHLPIRLINTPIFMLGTGVEENEFLFDSSKYSCLVIPSTASQYRGDTPQALAASLHSEFSASSSITELAARYRQIITAHLDHVTDTEAGIGRRALHVGCATGRLTFELATLFHTVIGQDINARFIDAASRLQAGESVKYVIDGKTHTAVAPPGESFRNVIFKQLLWLPREIGVCDVILWTQMHRLQNVRAWAAKLPELLKRQGLLMSVEDLQQPQTGLADVLQNNFRILDEVKPTAQLHVKLWQHCPY